MTFDKIKKEHFIPALDFALEKAKKEIIKIRDNSDKPTFENTIKAMETCSDELTNTTSAYFNLYSAHSDTDLKKLAQEISPKLAEFQSSLMLDEKLFARVKEIYNALENEDLTKEEKRLLKKNYRGFVRNGALLDEEKKNELRQIDQELSKLSPQFSQNVLHAENAYELHITDEERLKGLPESAKEAAAYLAKKKGKETGWIFNLQIPSVIPVLRYASDRELRKEIYMKFRSRAFKDDFDNRELIKKIVALRAQRAHLLGYQDHSEFTLEERMAKSPDKVMSFLNDIYELAKPAAEKELEELKKIARELDGLEEIMPWDSGYYSEKLKKKKFDFDEEELRPFFKMENVVAGLFKVAHKMYGLEFKEVNDLPVYHEEVKTYEVTLNKDFIGLLYMDLFPRETKKSGAWMSPYRVQGIYRGKIRRPHISVNANLTPSTDKSPSLLRLNEVTTLFHEFGHALHGLLSDCVYQTLASPNVYWDFVELPSQIMENWVKEKETLDMFAKHYKTSEPMPEELYKKIKAMEKFNKGMQNLRQVSLGLLDMGWHHKENPETIEDVDAYEKEVTEKTRLLPEVDGINTSCSFAHIFAGGYSSGYYSYKWAEVLEADAFELFKEKGIFNSDLTEKFRKEVLSKGNSEHPMDLFEAFRGRKPDPDALARRDGLIKE